jgi:preprotein translocase subunit SecE
VRNLHAKLDKALVPKVTFVINQKSFDKPVNRPYKKYKFVEKKEYRKRTRVIIVIILLFVTIVFIKNILLPNCSFRKFLVPKGVMQWIPKCNNVSTNPKGPN